MRDQVHDQVHIMMLFLMPMLKYMAHMAEFAAAFVILSCSIPIIVSYCNTCSFQTSFANQF